MIAFEQLFGVPKEHIQKTCVLTPFLSKGLLQSFEIETLHKGSPFSCGQSNDFSLIHTQVGAPFVGDAVLYLADSPCENLIFLGACGAVKRTDMISFGSVVIPAKALNCESFSDLVTRKLDVLKTSLPDDHLRKKLSEMDNSLVNVACASFGSFKLEELYVDFLLKNDIHVVEMEVCAFFHAARNIRRKGVALLYVTDLIGENHIFAPLSPAQQSVIHITQQRIFRIIREFTAQLQ